MPCYSWSCKTCGKIQDVERKMTEIDKQPDEDCCQSPDRERTLPKANIGFGPDWTRTSWKDAKGNKGKW